MTELLELWHVVALLLFPLLALYIINSMYDVVYAIHYINYILDIRCYILL